MRHAKMPAGDVRAGWDIGRQGPAQIGLDGPQRLDLR